MTSWTARESPGRRTGNPVLPVRVLCLHGELNVHPQDAGQEILLRPGWGRADPADFSGTDRTRNGKDVHP
jgi:hypothetical protein